MSSSKASRIIKVDQLPPQSIRSYSFGFIAAEAPSELPPEADGFVPCALGAPAPLPGLLLEEEPEPAPVVPFDLEGKVVLAEDELQSRVDEVFRNGMDEGRRQAERGLANVFKSLRDGVAALTGLRSRVMKESEEDLLRLAVMIARKIVQREVAQDPQVLAAIVAAAVGGCTERDRVVVRLNPDDYAQVSVNRQAFLEGLGEESAITLAPDETIGPGGCLVETATGTVDARIEAQLDEIYRSLLEERSAPVEPSSVPDVDSHADLAFGGEETIAPFKGQGAWVKGREERPRDDVQD
ncbi:FliH/SctL family protein [Geobacter anodireducens]|nr:flagellar assembly protein FliH [Geobacter anodireducens]